MVIKSDILLKGFAWDTLIRDLKPIFNTRTNYSLYILCLAIGIMYDQRLAKMEGEEEVEKHSVPRNIISNNDNGKFDFYFQAAILSTTTEDFSEDQRLEYAFGEEDFLVGKFELRKIEFLTEFANFGATILVEKIGDTNIVSMDQILRFLAATVEGNNLDINALPDDLIYDDIEEFR